MSYDLLSKKPGRRNWARDNLPDPVIAGSLSAPIKRVARGAMVLGTLTGLAFITSPWWRPLPGRTNPRRDPMRRRVHLSPGTPANNIMWSRR